MPCAGLTIDGQQRGIRAAHDAVAQRLAVVARRAYTHIEVLPISEHPLTAHGATSRWVCSRRPAVSAGRTSSAISLIAVIRPAEFLLVGLCRRRAERVP